MEPNDEIKRLLKQVVDHFDKEDVATRERQIRAWRKLKFLWDNLQHTYFSEVAHDWRVPENDALANDQDYYDKPVNVFRAYLESIIAALSINVPNFICYPDDATNPLDVLTAKTGDKIAQLLCKHNEISLFWLHALFIFCTEGMLACYHYPKEDEKFGVIEENEYEDVPQTTTNLVCPACGADMGISNGENPSEQSCPTCGESVTPITNQNITYEQRIVGIKRTPKTRIMMDVYGGLYVKVPVWARNQADCPYLIFSYETHYSNVLEQYENLRGKLNEGGTTSYDNYERWGRLSPQYKGEYPNNNVTVRNAWLRPSAFNILNEDETNLLKKEYPSGIKVVIVNDAVADVEEEALDDRWTLSYNPLSDYIHFDPIGLLLVSIQEITNDLVSLTVQTVEHGIPQTFANPKYLDFEQYRQQEVLPGGVYPTKFANGPLQDGFYQVKTATLSGEVLPFTEKVQELGQIVSGALPSLFGGQSTEGSRTASEYSMSRAQALQRLQTPWKMLTIWLKDIFTKLIPMYITELKSDERIVQRDELGNFFNVIISKSDAEGGKIGNIELEGTENLPVTIAQQKDAIMQLFQLNNPDILRILASPENLPYIRKAIGLVDYVIPDEDDRNKQYEEIAQLISSEPITIPDGMQQPEQQIPSVDIDPDVDNHAVQAGICRDWLVSDAGRQAKIDNPQGYLNVLLHMKAHKEAMGGRNPMQPNVNQLPPIGAEDGTGNQ